jgi:Putative zinc-binding metallo-peptidase
MTEGDTLFISVYGRLTCLSLVFAITASVACNQPSSTRFPTSAASLDSLSDKYALRIISQKPTFPIKSFHGLIEGKEATADKVNAFAPILTFEWNLYPVAMVQRTRLKRIVLCTDLSFAGQKRSAIPDFENDVLYLDVVRGSYSEQYVRKVIHHEYYHIIDLRDDGLLYNDDGWAQLNPRGFKYGSGGKNAQEDLAVSLGTDTPGFLNKYSMTAVEEDKAELFAHLMVEPTTVYNRATKDIVLRAKVARLKELMAAFCPEMDKTYWDDILRQR